MVTMQVTRGHILKILQERGHATVEELSEQLGLTSATIRHHLDTLRGEGLIETPTIRRRLTPGRPQYVYTLSEAANQHFPKNYSGLANMMLTEMKERLGTAQLDQVLQSMASRVASEFPPAPPDETFDRRVERAIAFLNEKGYMARCTQDENGYTMQVTNCPYRDVAHTHTQLCQLDLSLITRLLGVTPRRSEHIAEGEDTCTYHFTAPATSDPAAQRLSS
jgi:predicted ArsR family transcriptional regulator